jgi:hypothetical protein
MVTSSANLSLQGGTVAGQLVLVSSLFAQLCAPLDHVGQHFRDCVAAAEVLRELEGVCRTYARYDAEDGIKNIFNGESSNDTATVWGP